MSCKNGPKGQAINFDFDGWRMDDMDNDIRVYYNEINWAFVHRYFDEEALEFDSTVIGPFKGSKPDPTRFEFFNDDEFDPKFE